MPLCAHLAHLKRLGGDVWDPTGKRILELGSGTGIVGLALACLGAAAVTLTDMEPQLDLIRSNVQRNAAATLGCEISVRALRWESASATALHDAPSGAALAVEELDFVVASDCIYGSETSEPLARLLLRLLDAHRSLRLLLAYEKRPLSKSGIDHAAHFFELLRTSGCLLELVDSDTEIDLATLNANERPNSRRAGWQPDVSIWRVARMQ